jgi:hypothetical protein
LEGNIPPSYLLPKPSLAISHHPPFFETAPQP